MKFIWSKTDHSKDVDGGPMCDECDKDCIWAFYRDSVEGLSVFCKECAGIFVDDVKEIEEVELD